MIKAYPRLTPYAENAQSYRAQFERAIFFLLFARRVDEPTMKYAATTWLNDCVEWLSERGYNRVGLMALTAAVVASRVAHTRLDRFPHDVGFGLERGGARAPSSAWRLTLEQGVCEPSEVKSARSIEVAQVLIRPI